MTLNEIILEKKAKTLGIGEVVSLLGDLEKTQERLLYSERQTEILKIQLSWYQTQIYGSKSEKLVNFPKELIPHQLTLGEGLLGDRAPEVVEEKTIPEHKRKVSNYKKDFPGTPEGSGLRFDSTKAVVNEIKIPAKGIEGLSEDQYKVISTNIYYRVDKQIVFRVNKYIQDVVKLKKTNKLISSPLPASAFPGGLLETNFIVGVLVDKFKYYIPLFRQNQMLADSFICLSRSTLVNAVLKSANLLKPIYKEVLKSISESKIISMDEVPIRVGPSEDGGDDNGIMNKGYIWPVFGQKGEVGFVYKDSRAGFHIEDILGLENMSGKVLLSDGYRAYQSYVKKIDGLKHGNCWAHARRKFIEAMKYEPEACREALELIAKLYGVEKYIKENKIVDPEKILKIRTEQSKPVAEEFFSYLDSKIADGAFLPKNTFATACSYAFNLEEGLLLYLSEPDLPIDNNHVERAIRPIVMGRKNWMFCWSEMGAEALATMQTLISCCVLQNISPTEYLNDILTRIDEITTKNVREFIPREWKARQKKELIPV